ncbi:hypothetical protein ACU045_15985 [Microbacterium sp. MAHUQ-60]|uniref:hypothetical protein n=1 Tax=unclassified Microbacterium TaxID=2609290 RepID=UPI0036167B51
MSTEALLRQTVHPPCTEDEEILEITVPTDRAELAFSDRLSLRIGLWLLLRAQRTPRRGGTPSREDVLRRLERPRVTEREAITLLTYDLQRRLR